MRSENAPINAHTFNQICKLKRDIIDTDDYWLCVDVGDVRLTKQRNGKPSSASINIPRKDFDRLVVWYVTGKIKRWPKKK